MTTPDVFREKSAQNRKSRKRRELALLLPLLGVIGFASPVIDMFWGAEATLALKVAYIFGVWAVLIVLAFTLSRTLRSEMKDR